MASQRLKFGWYPQIPMMVAALITIVLSCASPSKQCFYVHPYTSAQAKLLEFEARLNDSIFYSEDVAKYDTAAYRKAVYDPYTGKFTGLENLRGPKLVLSLANKSKKPFQSTVESLGDERRLVTGRLVNMGTKWVMIPGRRLKSTNRFLADSKWI